MPEERARNIYQQGREAQLQSILDTAPEAIVVLDAQGMVESFNPSAEVLFGYSAAEVVGRNVCQLMPSLDPEAHDGYLAHYLKAGSQWTVGIERMLEGRHKDGNVLSLELAVGEIATNGQPHFVGFIRDLTARELMEDELRQSQKMEAIGQLTGGIAHDFNNLLTVVLGNLELLEEQIVETSQRLLLREVKDAGWAGAELTGRLLAFARRQPLNSQPLKLKHQVEEVVSMLRRTLSEAIEVRTVMPDNLPAVLADPSQLQNALLNLSLNARDAMPEGGTLVVRAEAVEIAADDAAVHADDVGPGRYLLLSVTDTGVGMLPKVHARAFEPFFTTKAVGAGSGLGLSMVYGFAKQSGGYTRIYSEPGHGTTVRLYLPQAKQAVSKVPKLPPVSPGAFPGRGETILVVEDNARVRRYVVTRLKGLGYKVLEAENGSAALRVLEQKGPVDLLFTDVIMPGGMTGIDLAGLAIQQWLGLRILFTSAYAEPELLQRGMADGGQWLPKPHTALALAQALRHALDKVPSESALPNG